jgi:hypothetical protein
MDNTYAQRTQRQQLGILRPFVHALTAQFAIQPASLRVVNHAFNTTYAVRDTAGAQYALRLNTDSLRDAFGIDAEFTVDCRSCCRRNGQCPQAVSHN